MLGGSAFIAFIRLGISLIGTVLIFSILSSFRFAGKKTVCFYLVFGFVLVLLSCVWYALHRESFVRAGALSMYICFAFFSLFMSEDSVYLTVYKLAFTFYLMAVFVIGGLEISIVFFNRNVWADIIVRALLVLLITFLLNKYVRKTIKGFGRYVEKEADKFSVAVMIICVILGIGYIMNPMLNKEMTPIRIYQLLINFFLVSTLQIIVYRFYIHVGKEQEYKRENQLIQLNYRLLERQTEILEESVASARRIRHDVRHHNAIMAEYARRGQTNELLLYLQEYDKEINHGIPEMICANITVNNILSAYTKKARSVNIRVILDVELGKELEIPSLDLVAILANAYENAIYACMAVKKKRKEEECFIHLTLKRKKNKLTISISNSCLIEMEVEDGKPKTEFTGGVGVSSIVRTAKKYGGEYDFRNDDGVFTFRLVMNMKPVGETLSVNSEVEEVRVEDDL